MSDIKALFDMFNVLMNLKITLVGYTFSFWQLVIYLIVCCIVIFIIGGLAK